MNEVHNDYPTVDQMSDAYLRLYDSLEAIDAQRRATLDFANHMQPVLQQYNELRHKMSERLECLCENLDNSWLEKMYRYDRACQSLLEATTALETMMMAFRRTAYDPLKGYKNKPTALWIAGAARLARRARKRHEFHVAEYERAIAKVEIDDGVVKAIFEDGMDWVSALIARPSTDAPVLEPLLLDFCRNTLAAHWFQPRTAVVHLEPQPVQTGRVVRVILPTLDYHTWRVERISEKIGTPPEEVQEVLSDAIDMGYGTSYVEPEPAPAVGMKLRSGESFRFFTRRPGRIYLSFRFTDWSKGRGIEIQRWQLVLDVEESTTNALAQ
jgi:hypothetical protein